MQNGRVTARLRVMVVHHEADFALKLADGLAAHGYGVMIARDMGEVLELLHDSRPNAILLDLHLRAMAGMQVLRIIKSIYPQIPVITITEAPLNELAHLSVKAGASTFLLKPFELQHMKTLIDAHLRKTETDENQPGVRRLAPAPPTVKESVPAVDQAAR
ncbi:MAG: response regulator [Nitrospiraceae bacterium]